MATVKFIWVLKKKEKTDLNKYLKIRTKLVENCGDVVF